MWSFIDNIPEANLDSWYRWLTVFAIGLPILGAIMGGVCGWSAFIVSTRIGNSQTAALVQVTTELNATQEKLAPWTLSDAQEKQFLAYLKDAPKGRVAIEYIRSDEKRSRDVAVKIKNMLVTEGYDVWGYMVGFEQADSPPLVGVQIRIKDKQSDVVGGYIQRAFDEIGIKAKGVRRTDNNYPDDTVVIWIGIKP
jgi:hypothetical protein